MNNKKNNNRNSNLSSSQNSAQKRAAPLRLNCDLGESRGASIVGIDEAVMPHIDEANIACGFHGGDPEVIANTLLLAKVHGVAVGAHPSYDDVENFGRRSMQLDATQIIALLHYQIGALDGMAASQGMTLQHVKPHGGLYNDMMTNTHTRAAVMAAVASYHRPLPLVLLATAAAQDHRAEARSAGITVVFEAFADRAYTDEGMLLPRTESGAVLNHERMLAQVAQLCDHRSVTTNTGNTLSIAADTLCVHGDNPAGVAAIVAIRALVEGALVNSALVEGA